MSTGSAAEERVGRMLLDKWRLERLIGLGGAAAIYAATHHNGHRVAIKVLHRKWRRNGEMLERFHREGRLSNEVAHPGTVRVFDDGVTPEGDHFLVMELLEGETLQDRWLRSGRALPVHDVLAFTDRMLEVLAAAHARKVYHRDLKPDNLFFTTDGQLKLLDFGIGRSQAPTPSMHATAVHVPMGTPGFMAPEQARGQWDRVDHRSDLWAVGATMFVLLTGRPVHNAMGDAMTAPAPSLSRVAPKLPRPVADLVDRALEQEPDKRFQSAQQMSRAVRELYWQVAPSAAPSGAPTSPRRPLPSSVTATRVDHSVQFETPDSLDRPLSDFDGVDLRAHVRHTVSIAVEVEEPSKGDFFGMLIDVSAAGALVRSRRPVAQGQRIRLTLRFGQDAERYSVSARVLRVSQDEVDSEAFLPFLVAVQFDRPDAKLERKLQEMEP